MKGVLLFVCISFQLLTSINLIAQDSTVAVNLTGVVLNGNDSTILSGAHVININTLKGSVSQEDGTFSLTVKPGDRILFSHLGFTLDTFLISESWINNQEPISVTLLATEYLLSIFDVLSISTFEEFEKAFLALELPDEPRFEMPRPSPTHRLPDNPAFTIYIPFDLGYFSKKAKDYRKYQAQLIKDQYNQMLFVKYNEKVVEMVTGVKSTEKINALMDYCDFSDAFIQNSLEYDLYVAIIKCYQSFEYHQKN